MNIKQFFIIALLTSTFAIANEQKPSSPVNENVNKEVSKEVNKELNEEVNNSNDFVKVSNKITNDLLNKFANSDKDIAISGAGVARLLSAIEEGADGESSKQINKYLKLNAAQLGDVKQDDALAKVDIMLFTDNNTINKEYKKYLEKAGFITANDLQKLNEIVFEKTNGKIKNAIEKIDPNVKLVLNNTLHFKDKWKMPFDSRNTAKKPFKAMCNGEILIDEVAMMQQKITTNIYRDEQQKMLVVAIPFVNDYSLFIAIDENAEINKDSAQKTALWLLEKATISKLMETSPQEIYLQLPKIEINDENNLIGALAELGIADIFDPQKANLKKMSDASLYVQKFLQKTSFTVDEQGAEASAATTVAIAMRSVDYFETIAIDKPFAFAIVQNNSGLIVISGKVQQMGLCNNVNNKKDAQEVKSEIKSDVESSAVKN